MGTKKCKCNSNPHCVDQCSFQEAIGVNKYYCTFYESLLDLRFSHLLERDLPCRCTECVHEGLAFEDKQSNLKEHTILAKTLSKMQGENWNVADV